MRAQARADATYNRLVMAVARGAALERDRTERELLLGVCMLCRRLIPQEAQHLIAQLPSKLQPQLDKCLDGPDRAVTATAIRDEFTRTVRLGTAEADTALLAVYKADSNAVSPGQINEVRGQLPPDMKELLPPSEG